MGFFDKIKQGLEKSKSMFTERVEQVIKNFRKVDEELLEELEEALIMADLGVDMSLKVVDKLRDEVKSGNLKEADEVKDALKRILCDMMMENAPDKTGTVLGMKLNTKPSVILVIGVNGVGKTTTIGKLAKLLKNEGKRVILAAGDTFRAAAADQLEIWADRAGVEIVRQAEGSDPASVVFDALSAAKSRGADVVICDTAGRLHNKQNLMKELAKISKVIDRELPGADCEKILVLDATTGQNAMNQAKTFKETTDITGIALTKLDSTAKGGIVMAITSELSVPVKFVCVGEGINDLLPFDAESFVDALFE